MAEPAAKRTRTEEESEEDFVPDDEPLIEEPVAFLLQDTTLNLVVSPEERRLAALAEGGLQQLLAGARASLGVRSGRYLYEVTVVERPTATEKVKAKLVTPGKPLLRLGFAAEGAGLLLADGAGAAYFDSLGNFVAGGEKRKVLAKPFGVGDTVAVLLNLDPAAAANGLTVSLFVNGKRACKPQALPQELAGQALFPALAFKGVAVCHNFGPEPSAPLPFTCRMLQGARSKDVVVRSAEEAQPEVIFPVALPDEGPFDWLDHFLQRRPEVVELSDRALLRWAEQSGVPRPKGYAHRTCNDKPDFALGVPSLDDGGARESLLAAAPLQRRSYVVMEVRGNFLKDERAAMLARWKDQGFKITAVVAMGEPPKAIVEANQAILLKEKQAKANADHEKKLEEQRRRREALKKLRSIERQRAAMLRKQKKAADRARRKLENDRKRKEAEANGEEFVEPEEPAEEEEEEKEVAAEEDQVMDETPPKVELTAEERRTLYRRAEAPDLTPAMLSAAFTSFELPSQEEGFDSVAYDWAAEPRCRELLQAWMKDKKITTRVEDITPGDWFTQKQKEWNKVLVSWHTKYTAYKAAVAKRATERSVKKVASRAAADRKVAAETKAEKNEEDKGAAAPEGKGAEAEKVVDTDAVEERAREERFEKLDVYGVEDVLDVGHGQPVFSQFSFEDWVLTSLRVELHLLLHAFRRDVGDPERAAVHVDHLGFYFERYFKRPLNPKLFGLETQQELLALVRDSVVVARASRTLEPQVPDDFESMGIFAMLQEEARRDRLRRLDLGDESAKLKVQQDRSLAAAAPAAARPQLTPANPKASGAWQKSAWQSW